MVTTATTNTAIVKVMNVIMTTIANINGEVQRTASVRPSPLRNTFVQAHVAALQFPKMPNFVRTAERLCNARRSAPNADFRFTWAQISVTGAAKGCASLASPYTRYAHAIR